MTGEDEALCGTLGEIVKELRRIGWDDDADGVERAARRIRELSAEVEALRGDAQRWRNFTGLLNPNSFSAATMK